MRLRVLIGIVLLIIGVGLPVAAVSVSGVPWGFRGHQGYLLEATPGVEITAGRARVEREKLQSEALDEVPGLALDDGDTIRVGPFHAARVRLPNAQVVLRDGAKATLGMDQLVVGRGVVEVVGLPGQKPVTIQAEGVDAKVTIQPGLTIVAADGKGSIVVVVQQGSAQVSTPMGDAGAGQGQWLRLVHSRQPVLVEAPPKAVTVTAACTDAGPVVGQTEGGTQLYLNGQLSYPDPDGRFSIPRVPGAVDPAAGGADALLFARDPAGNVLRMPVTCKKG